MQDEDEPTPEELVGELREALAAHAIKLPSLGVDPVTSVGWYPYPLVALGNCNVTTAQRLLTVLRNAVPEPQPQASGAELGQRVAEWNAAVRRHLGE
jgi:hypothetical protein